jgi:hypothetical protein
MLRAERAFLLMQMRHEETANRAVNYSAQRQPFLGTRPLRAPQAQFSRRNTATGGSRTGRAVYTSRAPSTSRRHSVRVASL